MFSYCFILDFVYFPFVIISCVVRHTILTVTILFGGLRFSCLHLQSFIDYLSPTLKTLNFTILQVVTVRTL